MGLKQTIKENWERVKSFLDSTDTYTEAAKLLCTELGLEYTDSFRRALSKVVNAELEKAETKEFPKILILDIETAPSKAYIWGIWQQNIGHNLDMFLEDWFILTWSAKWLFQEEVLSGKVTPYEAKIGDDERIVEELWNLLEEADVVIAHNGKKFDIKKINTRFLAHRLPPPMPYQLIDTLIHARKNFAITSNKLDFIAKRFLNLDGKLEHGGFPLWARCLDGEQQALDEMEEYNIQDVKILEDVYLEMRPWIKPHPNVGLFIGKEVSCCATCGSEELEWSGNYATYANTYAAYRCSSCGATGRSKKSNTINKSLTYSTPS